MIDTSLTDRIRSDFSFVASHARHVTIDDVALVRFAATLPDIPVVTEIDPVHHFIGDPEDMAAYILLLDTVNFGSGYKAALEKEGWQIIDGSIYYSVSTRLKKWFDIHGSPKANDIQRLPESAIGTLFELPDGPMGRALARQFTFALRQTARYIEDRHRGRWLTMVETADGRAESFASALTAIPLFQDRHAYDGRMIHMMKRAQIAAADMHYAFAALGVTLFHDMNRLTMFADNAVPHVLRLNGVLVYDTDLAERVDAGIPLDAGSPAEIEIRACAGEAVERLAAQKPLTSVQIDHILWHIRFSDPARYRVTPAHRTLTTDY